MFSDEPQETDELEPTNWLGLRAEPEFRIWKALLKAARQTASIDDSKPLVLNSFAPIRQQAADLTHSLRRIEEGLPTTPRLDASDLEITVYEAERSDCLAELQNIAEQLYALDSKGKKLAEENDRSAELYWRAADYPAEGWGHLKWSLFTELKKAGMILPSQDEG